MEISNCALLTEFETSLHTVESVLTLLSTLYESKFCTGNSDPIFMELTQHNGGVFYDGQVVPEL